jgi:hypothetical protein
MPLAKQTEEPQETTGESAVTEVNTIKKRKQKDF